MSHNGDASCQFISVQLKKAKLITPENSNKIPFGLDSSCPLSFTPDERFLAVLLPYDTTSKLPVIIYQLLLSAERQARKSFCIT